MIWNWIEIELKPNRNEMRHQMWSSVKPNRSAVLIAPYSLIVQAYLHQI